MEILIKAKIESEFYGFATTCDSDTCGCHALGCVDCGPDGCSCDALSCTVL